MIGCVWVKRTAMSKPSEAEVKKRIREAGERARAEAGARRAKAAEPRRQKEINGPKGPEPTRYGDWEKKGIASDF